MSGKFINPFTDFGFKRLFGEEANKDILMDFLNELLRDEEGEITSLAFIRNERMGSLALDRKAIFDIYCESDKGEKFIVEMQKAKQDFFKERSVFYSTFPIREQAEHGDWNFDLKAIYTIGILYFVFQEDKDEKNKFLYRVKLSDIETNKIFYDKLTFIYLEMPKFNKSIAQFETHFDRWMYLLKNLHLLDRRPTKLKERIFKKLFGEAKIANFNKDQLIAYEESLKYYRDIKNVLDTARAEGKTEGKAEGKLETARKMKVKGMDVDLISELTGLPEDDINNL